MKVLSPYLHIRVECIFLSPLAFLGIPFLRQTVQGWYMYGDGLDYRLRTFLSTVSMLSM